MPDPRGPGEQQPSARFEEGADLAQEALGIGGLEVTDRRAWKEHHTRMVMVVDRQAEGHRVIGTDGVHLEVRKACGEGPGGRQEMVLRDVDRHIDGRPQGLQ